MTCNPITQSRRIKAELKSRTQSCLETETWFRGKIAQEGSGMADDGLSHVGSLAKQQ